MSLKNCDYAFILSLRDIKITSDMTGTYMQTLYKPKFEEISNNILLMKKNKESFYYKIRSYNDNLLFSDKIEDKIIWKELYEKEKVEEWRKKMSEVKDVNITFYSPSELITYCECVTGLNFPLPTKHLPAKKEREAIIAYYKLKGHEIIIEKREYTDEQKILLDENIKGLYIVNAGPGTGKTTIVNQRAMNLRDENVLIISYTNSAINENYKRLHLYPGLSKYIGYKKYDKKINCITADSLAGHILGVVVDGDCYDTSIRSAINKCQTGYSKPKKGIIYKHIIVDECQDIDNLRGELICKFAKYSGVDSILLFGDPRQRIKSNSGIWYTNIWIENKCNILGKANKISFTYSHRFKNEFMIDLANSISERRKNIDHKLKSLNDIKKRKIPIKIFDVDFNYPDHQILDIAKFIKDVLHLKKRVPYSEICIIGPSLTKENKTSKIGNKICAVFKDYGIPCWTRSDGSYQPNGILFSTIHSVKGKEFDYIFVFGISNYPDTFYMIPYDEAESLIYVLHTRARKKIYYISHKCILPRGIEERFVKNYTKPSISSEADLFHSASQMSVSDVSTDFGFNTLALVNNFDLYSEEIEFPNVEFPKKPNDIEASIWGILCQLGVQIYVTKSYPDICKDYINKKYRIEEHGIYSNLLRKKKIYNGRDIETGEIIISSNSINMIRKNEYDTLKNILTKNINELGFYDYLLLTQIYIFLTSGHMVTRYDLSNINDFHANLNDYFIKIADNIHNLFGKPLKAESYIINDRYCGSIDIEMEDFIIELKTTERNTFLKTEYYQAWIYSLIGLYKTSILINIQKSLAVKICSKKSIHQWKYFLTNFHQLKSHVELTNDRLNKKIKYKELLSPIHLDYNIFVCDTEFIFNTQNSIIFDISIINLKEPYNSIISSIYLTGDYNLNFATEWLKQKKELFLTSPSLNDIKERFTYITSLHNEPVKIGYYACPVDISWSQNSININLSTQAKSYAQKHGIFISGNAPPKLTDLYGSVSMPLEFQSHLVPHTSLSDTLMLYELIHLDIISPYSN